MTQQESQETRTVSLHREHMSGTQLLELISALSWFSGWAIIGIAAITAYLTPARIVEYAGPTGYVVIQGVEFRQVLVGIFLMGFRTIIQGALWLKKKFSN